MATINYQVIVVMIRLMVVMEVISFMVVKVMIFCMVVMGMTKF